MVENYKNNIGNHRNCQLTNIYYRISEYNYNLKTVVSEARTGTI